MFMLSGHELHALRFFRKIMFVAQWTQRIWDTFGYAIKYNKGEMSKREKFFIYAPIFTKFGMEVGHGTLITTLSKVNQLQMVDLNLVSIWACCCISLRQFRP